jgi:hypothetical protein
VRKAKGEPLAALAEAAKLWWWADGNGDFMWDFMGFYWILHWILEDFTGFSWDILEASRNHEITKLTHITWLTFGLGDITYS